jgi:hypothetical protein
VLQNQYSGAVIRDFALLANIPNHTTKACYLLERNHAAIDAGIPAQVCLKANWTGDPLSSEVCVNEARFFRLPRNTLDLPALVYWFADWDDDAAGKQGLIMLDDLIMQGGQFGTSGQPLWVDDVATSLEQLARLHANTWALPELDRQNWQHTAVAAETPTDDHWVLMKEYAEAHNARPDHLAVLPKWASEEPPRMHSAFLQLRLQETTDRRPLCLVHGDAHAGNIYRHRDGQRIWLDWQIVRKGRPSRDVTYFVVGSLTIEDRRRSERELIRHYCDAMNLLGTRVDPDQAWADYRRRILWELIAGHLNNNPNEPTNPTVEKFCRASDDLDMTALYDA